MRFWERLSSNRLAVYPARRPYPAMAELFSNSASQSTREEVTRRSAWKMLKWGIVRDLACHPTKRIKVTARRNDIKDELICDLANRKEFIEAHNVSFIRTSRLRLEHEHRLYD